MEYLHVFWKHKFLNEPFEFYMELNQDRTQERVLEIYVDESIAYASKSIEFNTFLAKEPYPQIAEINEMPDFEAIAITKKEFENIWIEELNKIK